MQQELFSSFQTEKKKMIHIIVLLVASVNGFENDCFDKCTCDTKNIWCQDIVGEPKVLIPQPEIVEKFYVSYLDLMELTFLEVFEHLQLLSLFHVRINCTLIYDARNTNSFSIDAPNCPGIYHQSFISYSIEHFNKKLKDLKEKQIICCA